MSDKIEYSRLVQKRFSQPGIVPTIPASGSTTLSQLVYTDLLNGEFAINTVDKRLWFRSDNDIVELFGVSGGTYANLFIEGNSDTSINSIPNSDTGGINFGEYNFSVGNNNSVYSNNSALLGGVNNLINSGSDNSVVLGGSGSTVSGVSNVIMLGTTDVIATQSDTVYLENLVITDNLLTGSTSDELLVRSLDGTVKVLPVSELPSGGNQNLLQVLQTGDYASYGDTAYYLGQDGFLIDGQSSGKSYLVDVNAFYTQLTRSDDFNPTDGSSILLDSNGIRLDSNADIIFGQNVVNNKITYDGQTMDVENDTNYIASATTNSFMPKSYIDNAITGVTLTVDNGLTEIGGTVKLGGTLTEDTTIEASGNILNILNTGVSEKTQMYIDNTGLSFLHFSDTDTNQSLIRLDKDNGSSFSLRKDGLNVGLFLIDNISKPYVSLQTSGGALDPSGNTISMFFKGDGGLYLTDTSNTLDNYIAGSLDGTLMPKRYVDSTNIPLITNKQNFQSLGSAGVYNIDKENDKGKNIVVTCNSPSTVILPSTMLATDEGYAYNIINKKNSSATVYVQWGGTFDYWNLSTGGGMTVYWDGNDWVLLSENLGGLFIAGTSDRPTNLTNDDTGYLFGDTTLNKVQVWDGNSWNDILGGGGNSPIEISNSTQAALYNESDLEGRTIILRYAGVGSEIIFNYDISKCIIMCETNVKATFNGTVTDCSIKGDGVLTIILNGLVSSTHIIAEEITYIEATSSDFMARDVKACGNIETNNVRIKCETLLTEVTNSGPHFNNCDIDVNEYKIGVNTTDPNELLSCKAQIDLLTFDVAQNFVIDGGYIRVMEASSFVQVNIVANSGYLQYVRHTTTNIRLINGTSTHAYIVDYLDADLTLVGTLSQVLTNDCDSRVIRGQLK